jgi:uncharacterized membrane protein YhiD involved in acid resistance
MACGAGFYTIATMGVVLTITILAVIRYFEDRYVRNGELPNSDSPDK